MLSSQHEKQLAQQRTDSTFQVRRIMDDQPSATAILNDLISAKSASDFYREEINNRHKRFELEKQWPYLSTEEARLIEHYQAYMENVKQQQDKIMKTVSYKPTQREIEASEVETAGSDADSVVPGSTASARQNLVYRDRRVNEHNIVGNTVYTVYSTPHVASYKEMSDTHTSDDSARIERVRKLVFEIKKSPRYGADIFRGFVTRNAKVHRNQMLDQEDSRCLMNLSNLFYDNLYLDQIKGQQLKQSYFVLAFQNFVNGLQFKKDAAENVIVSHNPSLKVIKVLFEGQTRKIGANNFLRHIYSSKFSKIYIPQLQELIIRQILNKKNSRMKLARRTNGNSGDAAREARNNNNNNEGENAQANNANLANRAQEEERPGFFRQIGRIITRPFQRDRRRQERSTDSSASNSEQDDLFDFGGEEAGNTLSRTQRPQSAMDRNEPEINSDEYERIRIMLGAGQHGDQPRLSDIFLERERVTHHTDIGNRDPYNAMRYLNQEIDEEIENKNSMLKDLMVDQHNDPVQKHLQVQFDTEQFFNLQRQILDGGHAPDSNGTDSFNKVDKDLTEVCKGIVHQVLKSLVISTDLMPYTLRAMMKILVMKSESVAHPADARQSLADGSPTRPKLGRNQIYMLADLMIGCWLNTGFRNPNCFGVLQPTDREKGFSHNLFQSCRVIFEHLFSLQLLPMKRHQNFDVEKINEYISEYKDFVYIFYTRIIDVELPEPRENQPSKSNTKKSTQMAQTALNYHVNSSLIRLQDLKLISQILRSQKAVLRLGDIDKISKTINWSRFKDGEETYFLFTQLKKDRVVKMPQNETNEAKALKMIETMQSYFPVFSSDAQEATAQKDPARNLYTRPGEDKLSLRSNFQHCIKKDKKGNNLASMLLRVLYKHLITLVEQNAILLDEAMHGKLSLDLLLDYIKGSARSNEDGSGVVIACQLMKKALKGLGLIAKPTMSEESQLAIKLIQNKILEKFNAIFRDTTKHAFYTALISQDLKLQNFESDVDRFVYRSKGLQESIEKVIAQWQIAKISAQEVSLCVYQNQKDEFPCFQGIYLTRNCPIDQEWAALANVIAFDIFDTPRLPTNLNNTSTYLVPNQNRLVPARRDRQRIISQKYKQYTDFTWVSILRPQCKQHREITYLESLLLYLTQECRGIFTSLIKCDYLLETHQVKAIRSQNKALIKNYRQRNLGVLDKGPHTALSYALPNQRDGVVDLSWAQQFLRGIQSKWNLYNALQLVHEQSLAEERGVNPEDFVKFIEIDEKFARMQFIQHSIKTVVKGKTTEGGSALTRKEQCNLKKDDQVTHLLEIEQLMQDSDGKFIKQRMTNGSVIEEIQDHGNFLQTFDFFLDNLLCDFSQNVDAVRDYDQFLRQDMLTEKIRQSCQEFILRRIHNCLFEKLQASEWDRALFKVITERKNKMQSGFKKDEPLKPLYKDNQKDLNLYKVSIDMLKELPKEETPRAKRRLLNEAFSLAKHALSVLKEVDQYDDDYLFAYLMYYACSSNGKRKYDFRLFQQLVFMNEFGNKANSAMGESQDAIDIQFKSLKDKIEGNVNEQAVNAINKSSFIVF